MPPYWGNYDNDGTGASYEDVDADIIVPTQSWWEKHRPSWLTDGILLIIAIIIFLLGLSFLIAGSIMLGIGVSKSHKKVEPPSCPSITASPFYATVESFKITMTDVQNNYTNAANIVVDQVRSSLTANSGKAAVFATTNTDPYITVLGLSQSNSGHVMAVVGMAYTSADAPSSSNLENSLDHGNQMTLYHLSNDAAPSSQQQMCNTVSPYQSATQTTLGTTTSTPGSSSPNPQTTPTTVNSTTTSVTPSECVCPSTTVSDTSNPGTSPSTNITTVSSPLSTNPFGSTPSYSENSTVGLTTITSTGPPVTVTTSTVPPITPTTACQPITPSPRPGARDVVVLIDDSMAVGNASNYNQITDWLAKQLFPQWPVSSEKWEAAPAQYAQYQFTLLMDFDATSVNELATVVSNSVYIGRNAPSVTKALTSTLGLSGRPGVHRVILLISASSNLTDLETALPLAEQAKSQGSDIITLAVGGADGKALGILSSGPDYTFSSSSFALSGDQATQITDLIESGSRTTAAATTTVSTTTIATLVDFPCNPDIAVLFDTSGAVPSQEEYNRQLSFIADQLANSWPISPRVLETELIIYSTVYEGFNDYSNAYNYRDWQHFQTAVHTYEPFYNGFSVPSINQSFYYLISTSDNRRPGRTPTTILFTYAGNQDDVVAARDTLNSLGNLIVIGMGQNNQYLNLLTGNVITGMDYGVDMITKVNSLICSPSTPAPLPTTQVQTSKTSPVTTILSTTTTPTTMGTTITPQNCPDCYPTEANILIAMDSSSLMSITDVINDSKLLMSDRLLGGPLDILKNFVNSQLTSNWTHAERLGVLGFDDKQHFFSPLDFGDINTMDEFHQLVSAIPQLSKPPSLTSAFQLALSNFQPIAKYGPQKTVIFTISADPQDISNAKSFANQLSGRGTVVLVGMNMTDVSALRSLVPSVIAWPDLNNSTGIADQITLGLAGAFLNYTTVAVTTTTPSGVIGTTESVTTTATTTMGTTTIFSASPAVCSRDVILLIDESNAIPNVNAFNQLKYWVINKLIPLWEVNPEHIAVAPYGFADRVFNDLGGDFLAQSQAELEVELLDNLQYFKNNGPNIHSALVKATAIPTNPGAAIVLISASDSADDVSQASVSAKQFKQNGGTIITLAVGATSGQLGKLSSGLDFQYNSPDFNITNGAEVEISDVLCSSAPTTSPITTAGASSTTITTTTQPPAPFSCTPDVAFLFDNSGINSNSTLFESTVNYAADSVLNNWVVDPQDTEAAIVMGMSIEAINDENPWKYRNRDELAKTLHDMSVNYFGGNSSIYKMFEQLQIVAQSRRQSDPLTAVLFTYSSDLNDVALSLLIVNQLGVNVVAVGLGSSDSGTLGILTGNVATGMAFGKQLTDWINSAICNPKSPISTLPTTVITTPATSTTTTSAPTTTITTTAGPTTTQAPPEYCYDCYPAIANLFILVDNSIGMTNSTFNEEKLAILNLVANWTHMERIALGAYSNKLDVPIHYDSLRSTSLKELQLIISAINQTKNQADLGVALHQATGIVPNPTYGIQKTILFTSTAVVNDKASQAGDTLRREGQLIVVGIGMNDVTALGSLASPGNAIAWGDVTDTNTVAQDILVALSSNVTQPTQTSTQSMTTASTITSTQGSTTTLPSSVINCAKDVLLLIDDSNAYGNETNFNLTRSWIVNSLVPTWNVKPSQIAALPIGFANKSWNNIANGDFGDVSSVSDLQLMLNRQLYYLSTVPPSLAYGLNKAVSVARPQTVTVLISASEDSNDINAAYQSAMKLKQYGGAVITLSIGPTAKNYLALLSSGQNYSFVSTDYNISADKANSISALICGDEPLFTTTAPDTTTQAATTTVTTPPPPFSCTPDVAFLFDSSAINSNGTQLNVVMDYVANNVIANWNINPNTVEGGIVLASSALATSDPRPWTYGTVSDLQAQLLRMAEELTLIGSSSVTGLLSHLQSVAQTRRKGVPLVGVMFTFSTDYSDVVNSLAYEKDLDMTIVAVGLGSSDLNTLGLLTGNVITPTALDDTLTNWINNAICNDKPPIAVPTTVKAPTTTTMITSTATVPTTTITSELCSDCFPGLANLLIMVDNSMNQTATTFADQKQAVLNLISTWNHFERLAIFSYAANAEIAFDYGDIKDLSTATVWLNNLYQISKPANLGKALTAADAQIKPNPIYGQQQTIVFTTTVDTSDKAATAAGSLQSKGQLVMVGVAMADVSSLGPLASPGGAIAWSNVNDTQEVADNIMGVIGATSRPTIQTTSSVPTTSMGVITTGGSTTSRGTACPNDLIILLDDSIAIPTSSDFDQLKSWVTDIFLINLPSSISVDPIAYDTKTFFDMTGGFLPANIVIAPIKGQYMWSKNGPNITRALQKADGITAPDGTLSTLLISASSNTTDVNNAIPFAYKLKVKGGVVTLLVGSTGNDLTPLASEPAMSFSSKSFAPDDALLTQILAAICSNEGPLPTTSASTTTTVFTSTTAPTTTTIPLGTSIPTTTTATTTVTSTSSIGTTANTNTTTTTTTTVPPPTITSERCPDCVPAMANLLIMIDNSINQTNTTFNDQKQAVLNLISTWNHFERVAIFSYAANTDITFNYGDISDLSTVNIWLENLYQISKPANLGKALTAADAQVTPNPIYGQQQTIVFTTTVDTSDKATTAAGSLQSKGQLVMVGVAMADVSSLGPLASPGGAIAWSNVNDTEGVVDNIMKDINPTIGSSLAVSTSTSSMPGTTSNAGPVTSSSSSSTTTASSSVAGTTSTSIGSTISSDVTTNTANPVTTTAPGTTTGSTSSVTTAVLSSTTTPAITTDHGTTNEQSSQRTTSANDQTSTTTGTDTTAQGTTATSGSGCPTNLILLLDQSKAYGNYSNFGLFKTWMTTNFFGKLPNFIKVEMNTYYSNAFMNLTNGSFVSPEAANRSLSDWGWRPGNEPNMTYGLQRANNISVPDGSLVTILFSASDKTGDVQTAGPYANNMKAKGEVFTFLIGKNNNTLLPLASAADMSFSSASYTPSDDLTALLLTTLCSGELPTTTSISPSSSTVISSSLADTSSTGISSSITSGGTTNTATNPATTTETITTTLSPFVTTTTESPSTKPTGTTEATNAPTITTDHKTTNEWSSQRTTLPHDQTSTTTNVGTTTLGTTSTSGNGCPDNLILLLDQSKAYAGYENFNAFKEWVMKNFLVKLPDSIKVDPNSYDSISFNEYTNGSFVSPKAADLALTSSNFIFHGAFDSSITKGLQNANGIITPDGSLVTILFSASDKAADILTAEPYANNMKEKGEVFTFLLGKDGDTLRSLASGINMSFSSASYTPSDDLTALLLATLCPGELPTTTSISPSTTTVIPSSVADTSSTGISSSITSGGATNTATNPATTTETITTILNPFITTSTSTLDNTATPSSVADTSSTGISSTINSGGITNSVTIQTVTTTATSSTTGYNPSSLETTIVSAGTTVPTRIPSTTIVLTTAVDASTSTKATDAPAITTDHGITNGQSSQWTTSTNDQTSTTADMDTTVQGTTATSGNICPDNLILLLDQSKAYGVHDNFDEYKKWLRTDFLVKLPNSIKVYTYGYDAMSCSNLTQGSFVSPEVANGYLTSWGWRPAYDSNITKGFVYADKIIVPDGSLVTILFSASDKTGDIRTAEPYATSMKAKGEVFTFLIGKDNSNLLPLASEINMSFASANYTPSDDLTALLLATLCPGELPTATSTSSSTTTVIPSSMADTSSTDISSSITSGGTTNTATNPATTTETITTTLSPFVTTTTESPSTKPTGTTEATNAPTITTDHKTTNEWSSQRTTLPHDQTSTTTNVGTTTLGTTSTSGNGCPDNLILLLDQSKAYAGYENFNAFKEWVMKNFLVKLPDSIKVDPNSYDSISFNEYTNGSFVSPKAADLALTSSNFIFHGAFDSSITKGLQNANGIITPDGSLVTILFSASDKAADILTAEPYANNMKEKGEVFTFLLGKDGDTLRSLASGINMSFSSASYTPSDDLTALLLATLCPGELPTTTSISPSSSTVISSSLADTSSTDISSTISSGGTTNTATNPAATTETITTTLSPFVTTTTESPSTKPTGTTEATNAPTITTDHKTTNEWSSQRTTLPHDQTSTITGTDATAQGTTATSGSGCPTNLILLLDQSKAYGNYSNFGLFKTWMTTNFFGKLPNFIKVEMNTYYSNAFMNLTNGSFVSPEAANRSLSDWGWRPGNEPNMTYGLQRANNISVPDGSLVTILFSASDKTGDVQTAGPYANNMKAKGEVFTFLIGKNNNTLLPLASAADMSFSSASYTPSDDLTALLLTTLCSGETPTMNRFDLPRIEEEAIVFLQENDLLLVEFWPPEV